MDASMVETSDVMIDFRDVTKRYGRTTAVDRVSFQVHRGEICGFLGPNGAGKTTSLRMLLGLVHPTSGHIEIQGMDVQDNTARALEGVGAIIEESHFYPYLTGEQNLRQVLRLRGLDASPEEIRARLSEVGLGEASGRRVKGYSLGMRQRLALALAMLQDPAILILDEPMNGLDPAAMREFRMHLLNLAESGVTILLSSHILSEVEQLATRLVFINQGRVVGIENRRASGASQAYVRAANADQLAAWIDRERIEARAVDDGAFAIPLENPAAISALIRTLVNAGIDLVEVKPFAENLESQYLDRMAVSEEVLHNEGA